jgi:hypothetical protein
MSFARAHLPQSIAAPGSRDSFEHEEVFPVTYRSGTVEISNPEEQLFAKIEDFRSRV